jgi:hypothetical protein
VKRGKKEEGRRRPVSRTPGSPSFFFLLPSFFFLLPSFLLSALNPAVGILDGNAS